MFIDNAALGLAQGSEYVTTVSADGAQIGRKTAETLSQALGGKGKIGYIFHDANFHVTNLRDKAFKWYIENKHPGIEIAAEAGMADPAKIEEIVNAVLVQNPDIKGLYLP